MSRIKRELDKILQEQEIKFITYGDSNIPFYTLGINEDGTIYELEELINQQNQQQYEEDCKNSLKINSSSK